MNAIYSHDRALADLQRVLGSIENPKKHVNTELERWKECANLKTAADGKTRVVVDMGGKDHYQVWTKNVADGSSMYAGKYMHVTGEAQCG